MDTEKERYLRDSTDRRIERQRVSGIPSLMLLPLFIPAHALRPTVFEFKFIFLLVSIMSI